MFGWLKKGFRILGQGFRDIFDPTPIDYNRSKRYSLEAFETDPNGFERDRKALSEDCAAVGNDMHKAFLQVAKEDLNKKMISNEEYERLLNALRSSGPEVFREQPTTESLKKPTSKSKKFKTIRKKKTLKGKQK